MHLIISIELDSDNFSDKLILKRNRRSLRVGINYFTLAAN